MLVKMYDGDSGKHTPAERRYRPAVCTGLRTQTITGNPDPDYISRSCVEMQNLTARMQLRRFTRAHPPDAPACGSTSIERDYPREWIERWLLPLIGYRTCYCRDAGNAFGIVATPQLTHYRRPRPFDTDGAPA